MNEPNMQQLMARLHNLEVTIVRLITSLEDEVSSARVVDVKQAGFDLFDASEPMGAFSTTALKRTPPDGENNSLSA